MQAFKSLEFIVFEIYIILDIFMQMFCVKVGQNCVHKSLYRILGGQNLQLDTNNGGAWSVICLHSLV